MLAAARVLKLVDEQVPNSVSDGHGSVGGKPVVAFEHSLGDLGNLDKVDGRRLRENDLELASGVAQQRETGAYNLPVVVGVTGGRQIADRGQGGFKAGNASQVVNEGKNPRLLRLAIGGKS